MNRRVVAVVVALTAAAALVSGATWAVFTHQRTIGSNTLTAGTITLGVNPSSALITYTNMRPGDGVTSKLLVSNSGTAQLRYALSATATDADNKHLKDQLVLTIKSIDQTTPGAGTECDNFDGTETLYTGDLDSTAGKLFGDADPGPEAGDRTLAAGAGETLCFRVSLPGTTGNAFAGATSTVTFAFTAEQTANNNV